MNYDSIRIVFSSLPCTIKAYTIRKDDYYTIVLNSNLSHEQNKISYIHELEHIENGDFDNILPVGMIEINAHNK